MRRIALAARLAVPIACAIAATIASPAAVLAQPKKPAPAAPAAKDPKLAEAKKLFEDGSAAYADGKYEDAIKAWEKSYELSQKPLIFESIASAYERLGDKKKAREYFSKWREAAPKEEWDQLDARIKNLDSRIAADEAKEKAALDDDAKKKAEREAAEKAARDEAKAREAARSTRLKLAIGVGAAGVVAVGVGVVLDVVASGQRPDPKTACTSAGGKTLCKESAKDGIDGSSTLALVGDISWIAGAAIAATGAVLLITLPSASAPPRKDEAKPPAKADRAPDRFIAVTPIASPTGGGVGLTGRF